MPRKKTPDKIKKLQGTERADRKNTNVPSPERLNGPVPSHLSKLARAKYIELRAKFNELNIATNADKEALEILAEAYADWRQLKSEVSENGYTYETVDKDGNKLIKANPAYNMLSDAYKRVKSILVEFGLTPASLSNVSKHETETDPLQAFLN